jgi:Na+/phosphate symporter
MISRTFVIVLAFGAAAYRASQAAWVEAAGLVSLGAGLILLGMAARRPGLKPFAWLAFLLTAVSIGVVLLRGART